MKSGKIVFRVEQERCFSSYRVVLLEERFLLFLELQFLWGSGTLCLKNSLGLAEKFHVYEKSMQCTVLTVVWKTSVCLLIFHLPWTVSVVKHLLVLGPIRRQRLFYKCSHTATAVFEKAFRFGFVEEFKGASLHIYFLYYFSLSSLSWFPASSCGTNKQTKGVRPQSLPAAALSGQRDEISCPQLWVEHPAPAVWAGELMVPNDSHLQLRDGWCPSLAWVKPICAVGGVMPAPSSRERQQGILFPWLPCYHLLCLTVG